MFGGISAYIANEVGGAVRRNVTVYGLYAFAGLLVVSAAGYALAALHTFLAFRYGPILASLCLAGGLLVAALIAVFVAGRIKNAPRPAKPIAASALVAAPVAMRVLNSRRGWKMGALAGLVVGGVILARSFLSGDDAGGGGI